MPIIFPRKFADHFLALAHNYSMIDEQTRTASSPVTDYRLFPVPCS